MKSQPVGRALGVLIAAFGVLTPPRPVIADEKLECVHASDAAQEQRAHGHLLAARDQLLVCVRDACPGPVRAFCEQWLGEVERATPSVAIRLTDHAGHDVTEARVLVDGRLVTSRLDGRPFTVDPGVHVFRFEPAGAPAFEDRLVIVEAEKDRVVTEGVPSEPTPGPVGQSPSWIRGAPAVPVGVFVLGGVGLAGLAGFAYFAISGASDYDGCVQRACDPSTQSSLALRRALAWTSLGAGVIALGAGSWVFLSSRSAGEPRVAIEALPGGALAQVQAGF